MDYQSTNQTMEQDSSAKMWWIIGGIVILAVAGWYFYGSKAPIAGTQTSQVTADNTTTAIANDFNATPDVGAGLTADQAASAQTVSGF